MLLTQLPLTFKQKQGGSCVGGWLCYKKKKAFETFFFQWVLKKKRLLHYKNCCLFWRSLVPCAVITGEPPVTSSSRSALVKASRWLAAAAHMDVCWRRGRQQHDHFKVRKRRKKQNDFTLLLMSQFLPLFAYILATLKVSGSNMLFVFLFVFLSSLLYFLCYSCNRKALQIGNGSV